MELQTVLQLKRIISVCFLLIAVQLVAVGQKLPNVQQSSLKAPAKIKIDGKADEWHDQFQAYNRATSLLYTTANDGKNIYFAIRAKDPLIEKKILMGGISITMNKTAKKNEKSPVVVTYPMLSHESASAIGSYLNQMSATGSASDLKANDSLVVLMNRKFEISSKLISFTSATIGQDSLISVYNDKGIKAMARFDKNGYLTYELAIPLAYLKLPTNPSSSFSYNLKVNGIFTRAKIVMLDPNASPDGSMVLIGSSISGKSDAENQALSSTTDCWGLYQLAK